MTGHKPETHKLLTLVVDGDKRVARCVCGWRTFPRELHEAVGEWHDHRHAARLAEQPADHAQRQRRWRRKADVS